MIIAIAALGALCGVISTAFYFEAKYIDKLSELNTVTIELGVGYEEDKPDEQ